MLLAWWGHKPYPADGYKEVWLPCVCECVTAGVCRYIFSFSFSPFFFGGMGLGTFLMFFSFFLFLLGLAQFWCRVHNGAAGPRGP